MNRVRLAPSHKRPQIRNNPVHLAPKGHKRPQVPREPRTFLAPGPHTSPRQRFRHSRAFSTPATPRQRSPSFDGFRSAHQAKARGIVIYQPRPGA